MAARRAASGMAKFLTLRRCEERRSADCRRRSPALRDGLASSRTLGLSRLSESRASVGVREERRRACLKAGSEAGEGMTLPQCPWPELPALLPIRSCRHLGPLCSPDHRAAARRHTRRVDRGRWLARRLQTVTGDAAVPIRAGASPRGEVDARCRGRQRYDGERLKIFPAKRGSHRHRFAGPSLAAPSTSLASKA